MPPHPRKKMPSTTRLHQQEDFLPTTPRRKKSRHALRNKGRATPGKNTDPSQSQDLKNNQQSGDCLPNSMTLK